MQPVLDTPGVVGFARSYGEDVNFIAKMGVAEARGLHDAGVLSVAKRRGLFIGGSGG